MLTVLLIKWRAQSLWTTVWLLRRQVRFEHAMSKVRKHVPLEVLIRPAIHRTRLRTPISTVRTLK